MAPVSLTWFRGRLWAMKEISRRAQIADAAVRKAQTTKPTVIVHDFRRETAVDRFTKRKRA